MNVLDKLNQKWSEAQENEIEKNNITFSFLLEIEKVETLRNVETFRRKTDFHYSVSDAVREGIQLMIKDSKDLVVRPVGLIPTRRGKRSNNEKKERVFTSYRISESEREFIYDYIYNKCLKMDGNFTKDDFMEDLIKTLKLAYKEIK